MVDRVNYDHLQLNPDGNFYWQEEPFTGTAFELYPDGQLHREVEMVEGEANGYWCKHFRYDQRKLEGFVGGHFTWTRDRSQVSNAPIQFHIKETIWDDLGKIVAKDARTVAAIPQERVNAISIDMDTDDLFIWQEKPFTGIVFDMYFNGQLAAEHEILEGKANGVLRAWLPSGTRRWDGYTSLSGLYSWRREWFPQGALQRESISGNGVLIQETVWNESGEVESTYEGPRLVTSSGQ